jgi:cyanophycinase
MWPGILILQSGLTVSEAPLAEPDLQLLSASLSDKDSQVLIVVESATGDALDLSKVLEERGEQVIRFAPVDLCNKLNDAQDLATWAACESVWIDTGSATSAALSQLDVESHMRLEKCLGQVLANGGFVRITGDLSWLGTDRVKDRKMLLANCKISTAHSDWSAEKSLVNLYLPDGSRCAFAKRQLINIAEDHLINVKLAPTDHYSESLSKSLKNGELIDWVQWQRTLLERQSPMHPGPARVEHVLAGGSLVIGGGGGMPEEVWKRFVELAGGKNARIVILPTAVEDPQEGAGFEARVLKQAGAEHIVTLPQIQRSEIEEAAFLAELERSTGVWFGGGRQWRFVDAYWGTLAWEKLRDVCKRGGVIGGSSAGATIQGDLLVRGAPVGNHIMIADGYRRGLGLLPGVAIDQHFSQRNRFRELEGCLAEFPSISGIGIDEQTALVVTAPDQCTVMGTGSVWLYPSYDANDDRKPDSATRAAMRKEYKSGSEFTLVPK